jgi:hypothetical protein
MSHFQLNFFSVVFPDGVELPILTRKLADGEDLRAHEQLLKPKSSTDLSSKSRMAGVVRHLEAGRDEYVVEKRALRDLPIGIVRRLVEEGLRRTLTGRGILVEHALTEFHCFRPDDFYSTDTPSFLRIRRGVQFRSDCIYVSSRPVFGFFVSSKSRVYFAEGVTEPAVAQAAIGARVWADSPAGSTSGKLIEVRNGSARLEVQGRHDDAPREVQVAAATMAASRRLWKLS